MKLLKKTASLCLCIAMCLGLFTGIFGTVLADIAYAANYRSELWLADDVEYALKNGERIYLGEGNAPYKNDTGTMYIPLSVLADYAGAEYTYTDGVVNITLPSSEIAVLTVGSPSWTLGGVKMEDFLIPVQGNASDAFISILMARELFSFGDYFDKSMGLLILSRSGSVTGYDNSYSSVKNRVSTACKFIMDRPSGETVYSDMLSNGGADVHPRLVATQDEFDKLKGIFKLSDSESVHFKMIEKQVLEADNCFDELFVVSDGGGVSWKDEEAMISVRQPYYVYDENGNRLAGYTEYTYTDSESGEEITLKTEGGSGYGDGYDVGGRSNLDDYSRNLRKFAFAWQMTGESRYADAFYLYALELEKWEHWGEGHFLNVADGAYQYAIGLDWIYHAFDDEPEKREKLADILYKKGMMMGYYSLTYNTSMMHISRVASTGWNTANRDNNWQTVCGAGMIVSALMLMEYDEYRADAQYVAESYIKNVEKCLIQYAKDGAYPESVTYWAYGTNALMDTLISLENSCGRSYGYRDILGLHESYYFAIGMTDSEYNTWSYHDAGTSKIPATHFLLASNIFDDSNLRAYRNKMLLENPNSSDVMDAIYFDESNTGTDYTASLDSYFAGFETASFKSSLDDGATFAGLHAGPTHIVHGDFDTGNFVLSMGGVIWCGDPGTEDYNIPGFWDTSNGGTRYKLYKKSLEAHSTVVIRSDELIHGQKYVTVNGSYPVINNFYTDENGGYAITNMTSQYGSTCTSASRGLLMTNSRRTVVLQDEISFSSPTSLSWVLNINGGISISDDGRSVIAIQNVNGKNVKLRISLLTDDSTLKFRRLNSSETVLPSTIINSPENPMVSKTSQRIVIDAADKTEFNVAVVFEILRHEDEVIGYEKLPMSEWTTSTDEWLNDANSGIVYPEDRPNYKYTSSDFAKAIDRINSAESFADKGVIIRETIVYLTDYDTENASVTKYADTYKSLVTRYNAEVDTVNRAFEELFAGAVSSGDFLN